jgi:16S rRNA G966 N2-methylase RsmD
MNRRLTTQRKNYNEWRMSGGGKNSFPYRIITKAERDNGYEKLKALKFKPNEEMNLSIIGNKTSDYYFQKYRVKTKASGNISPYERWKKNPQRIKDIDKKIHRNYPKTIGTITGLRSALSMDGDNIGQFKPYVAVYIYQKFKPKRILDISAGWGDRLIGAMSQNIDYIGIDSNKKLETPYNNMIKDFKDKTTSNIKMIFDKSENINYSKLPKYDLIFTSPPYFSLEKYEGMTKYKDDEEFSKTYFIPTIKKSWQYLNKNGILALNMPEEMYKLLIPILGSAKVIKMPIQNRFNFEKKGESKFENIYWWKK